MNYQLAYRIGFHPWEDAEGHAPFVEKFAELLDEEEHGRDSPYGAALDLGTGSGIWAIQLAKRGWRVTGVDLVDKAMQRARERVDAAGVEVELVRGNVTALRESGVGSDFRLLLDTGTFHGLKDHERVAMGREVDAVAAPDATMLLLAWPRRRRPLIRGANPWRRSKRDRGSVLRLDRDRRRSIALQTAEADRSAPEARRTLVSASSSGLAQRRRRCHGERAGMSLEDWR